MSEAGQAQVKTSLLSNLMRFFCSRSEKKPVKKFLFLLARISWMGTKGTFPRHTQDLVISIPRWIPRKAHGWGVDFEKRSVFPNTGDSPRVDTRRRNEWTVLKRGATLPWKEGARAPEPEAPCQTATERGKSKLQDK